MLSKRLIVGVESGFRLLIVATVARDFLAGFASSGFTILVKRFTILVNGFVNR